MKTNWVFSKHLFAVESLWAMALFWLLLRNSSANTVQEEYSCLIRSLPQITRREALESRQKLTPLGSGCCCCCSQRCGSTGYCSQPCAAAASGRQFAITRGARRDREDNYWVSCLPFTIYPKQLLLLLPPE